MKSLKENSIRIDGTIVVCWPNGDRKDELVDMSEIGLDYDYSYTIRDSTICFVLDHEVFVTPYTRKAITTIQNAGLTMESFNVPFSRWAYPKFAKDRWSQLLEAARESYYHDYENDCVRWCDSHGIGSLSEKTLRRCFRMPRNGVPVKRLIFEDTYYPLCNEFYFSSSTTEKIGHYGMNDGKVVFIYRDGHTYIAKGYWILDELHQAGYKESDLPVPISDKERITNLYLAALWEQMK